MKKRIVTIALVIALLCTCFAGTYAYLTDTDAATNVMTLGNVDIEQLEFERDADGNLVTFSQDKRLYPAVNPSMEWSSEAVDFPTNVENAARGSQLMFVEPNAQDKFVFVKNTSTLGSEAFVRTLIALEAGSKTEAEIDDVITDLAKTMSFNPLPTGVCLYDFRRGNCTDGDGCFFYNCPNYITEVQFYPILKDELDLLEKEMARLKKLGHEREWQKQYIKYKYLKPLVESLEVQLNGKKSIG